MKTSIKKDLHTKTAGELSKKLSDLSEEIRVMRLDHTMGKLKNISSIGNKREEIAVAKTILREKVLSQRSAAVEAQKDKDEKKVEKKEVKGGKK